MTTYDLTKRIASGEATTQDFEDLKLDPGLVMAEKEALPYQCRLTSVPAGELRDFAEIIREGVPKPGSGEPLTVPLVLNTQTIDRMGDLVIASPNDARKFEDGEGWQTERFLASGGPYLWSHMGDVPAVGRVTKTKIQKVPVGSGDTGLGVRDGKAWGLVIQTEFFNDDAVGPLAVPAYYLTVKGITSSSAGFIGKKSIRPDDRMREQLGLGKYGLIFSTSELLEASKAQVPANAASNALSLDSQVERALAEAVERGWLDESLVTDFKRTFPLGPEDEEIRLRDKVRGFMPQLVASLPPERVEEVQRVWGDEEEVEVTETKETETTFTPENRNFYVGPDIQTFGFATGGDNEAAPPEWTWYEADGAGGWKVTNIATLPQTPDELREIREALGVSEDGEALSAVKELVERDESAEVPVRALTLLRDALDSATEASDRVEEVLAIVEGRSEYEGLTYDAGPDAVSVTLDRATAAALKRVATLLARGTGANGSAPPVDGDSLPDDEPNDLLTKADALAQRLGSK